MKLVFLSYNYSPDCNSPDAWINRIKAYVGSLEYLAKANKVIRVEQINYTGDWWYNGIQYYFTSFGKKKTHFPLKLNQLVKRLDADVVFVHGLHYPIQVMLLRLQLKSTTRIIAQHHAEKPFTGLKKYLQKMADRCIDAYLFASFDMGINWVKKGNLAVPQKIHEVMEMSSVFYPIEKKK